MALRKRLLLAISLLLGLIVISTTGYRLIGGPSVTFLQALYMAVITLAGVGYGEIVDTSQNPVLRVFNIGFGGGRLPGGSGVHQPFLEAQNAATH
jgi:hypothetical protein